MCVSKTCKYTSLRNPIYVRLHIFPFKTIRNFCIAALNITHFLKYWLAATSNTYSIKLALQHRNQTAFRRAIRFGFIFRCLFSFYFRSNFSSLKIYFFFLLFFRFFSLMLMLGFFFLQIFCLEFCFCVVICCVGLTLCDLVVLFSGTSSTILFIYSYWSSALSSWYKYKFKNFFNIERKKLILYLKTVYSYWSNRPV